MECNVSSYGLLHHRVSKLQAKFQFASRSYGATLLCTDSDLLLLVVHATAAENHMDVRYQHCDYSVACASAFTDTESNNRVLLSTFN